MNTDSVSHYIYLNDNSYHQYAYCLKLIANKRLTLLLKNVIIKLTNTIYEIN